MDTYSVLRWGVALVGAVLFFEAVLPGAPVVRRVVGSSIDHQWSIWIGSRL